LSAGFERLETYYILIMKQVTFRSKEKEDNFKDKIGILITNHFHSSLVRKKKGNCLNKYFCR